MAERGGKREAEHERSVKLFARSRLVMDCARPRPLLRQRGFAGEPSKKRPGEHQERRNAARAGTHTHGDRGTEMRQRPATHDQKPSLREQVAHRRKEQAPLQRNMLSGPLAGVPHRKLEAAGRETHTSAGHYSFSISSLSTTSSLLPAACTAASAENHHETGQQKDLSA